MLPQSLKILFLACKQEIGDKYSFTELVRNYHTLVSLVKFGIGLKNEMAISHRLQPVSRWKTSETDLTLVTVSLRLPCVKT